MNKIIIVLALAALSFRAQSLVLAQTNPPPKPQQQKQKSPTSKKPLAEAFSKAIRAVAKIEMGDNERVGSGVLVGTTKERTGLILTAYHVVKGYSRVSVSFFETPKTYRALISERFIAPKVDLALIVVENLPSEMQTITFGKNCGEVGDHVAAIGHPLEEAWKLDEGILNKKIEQFWLSSVPVRWGSSGGPLLDENGRMLGVIQERTMPSEKEVVMFAYRSEFVIPTLEGWLEKVKLDKKWRVEPKSCIKKIFTEWKYGLPTLGGFGVVVVAIVEFWPNGPVDGDLPGMPGFPNGN